MKLGISRYLEVCVALRSGPGVPWPDATCPETGVAVNPKELTIGYRQREMSDEWVPVFVRAASVTAGKVGGLTPPAVAMFRSIEAMPDWMVEAVYAYWPDEVAA